MSAMATPGTGAGIGRPVDLDLSGAWLVDPVAGREGPADLVVREGVLESVTWLDAVDAGEANDRGVLGHSENRSMAANA